MERRNLALLCAGVVCFWLFALAFGTAQDSGLRWVEAPAAAQTAVAGEEMQPAALTAAQPDLTLNCRAVCLIDQDTGTVLYEKNADQQMPIASITKVMTLLLTFEAIHDGRLTLDTLVPVSEHAYHMGGSQIWLEPGEQFTLDEMIKAICVSSANDAAVAVAELVGGSEQGFVQMMNDRAAELGMTNTTFHNACGLDTEGHLSTARDVAIMSRQILTTCPEVLHYTGIWTDTLRGGATQLVNTNKMLRRYNGITGLKTGTTSGAGVCISASATRDGLNLIAVVLGAPSSKDRFEAATTLLDYGFAAWRAAPLPAMEDRPLLIKVKGSAEESVPLEYSALPESILMPKESAAELTAQLTLPDELDAPVQQGQAVGMVRILAGESVLGEYDICSGAFVKPEAGLDCIIVLGAKVNGTEPSGALAQRIDAAAEYLMANPDTVCIASGGQGDDEGISEAECIRRYLINYGIDPERVLLEDKSTSTLTNIENSLKLLPEGAENIGIVTNDFHIFRALATARHVSALNFSGIPAPSTGYGFTHYALREFLAVGAGLIKGELSF